MTQTPASGPSVLVTTPPMSSLSIRSAGSALGWPLSCTAEKVISTPMAMDTMTEYKEAVLPMSPSFRPRVNAGLFKLITGGHRYAQDINPFGLFDVADEVVLVFQFVVAQRWHLGSGGFDTGPDKMRSVVTEGVTHGLF